MQMTCWSCGHVLEGVILPVSRREECDSCGADQHVCKMCKDYDVATASCNEPRAEDVSDREKANFCDFFAPSGKQFEINLNQKAQHAKAQLAELFGEPIEQTPMQQSTDDLTPAQLAERKLREMLKE